MSDSLSRRDACKVIGLAGLGTTTCLGLPDLACGAAPVRFRVFRDLPQLKLYADWFKQMNVWNPTSRENLDGTTLKGRPYLLLRNQKYRSSEFFGRGAGDDTIDEAFCVTSFATDDPTPKRKDLHVNLLAFGTPAKVDPDYWTPDHSIEFLRAAIDAIRRFKPEKNVGTTGFDMEIRYHKDRDWRGYKEILSYLPNIVNRTQWSYDQPLSDATGYVNGNIVHHTLNVWAIP